MTQSFNLEDFLDVEVRPFAQQLDSDSYLLAKCLRRLVQGFSANINMKENLPSNSDVEKIYGASTAVAFIFMQHIAVIERLQTQTSWQNDHYQLWNELSQGVKLCGLSTTHLANPQGAQLKATLFENNYRVTGKTPWVTGFNIFDYLLIGFEVLSEIKYALIEFPNSENKNYKIESLKLICLNGINTVSIYFDHVLVLEKNIVSSRDKNILPAP